MNYLLPVLGLILLAWALYQDAHKKLSPGAIGNLLGVAVFLFGLGIHALSYAGSINAILAFESAKEAKDAAAFEYLHTLLDPQLLSGFLYLGISAVLFGAAVTFWLRRQDRMKS